MVNAIRLGIAERGRHRPEPLQSIFEALDDLSGDHVRRRQEIGIVQSVILQPEDIQVELVAGEQGLKREAPELFSLLAFEVPA